ncbi:MAG: hypothetical protein KAT33_05880 [Bacteroidales bacterium]|nr:hypothetical protein [Bacteroidales bacterium]
MKINRNNYEIFFLDYMDGNLDPALIAELLIFLEENPGLKEEFEDFELISVPVESSVIFEDKNNLKKNYVTGIDNINSTNYQNYFIASLENDLSAEELNQLKLFLKTNPSLTKEYKLFENTFSKPDKKIVFADKKTLKRYPFSILSKKAVYYSVSIAASILILFSILFIDFNNNITKDSEIPTKIASVSSTSNFNKIQFKKYENMLDYRKMYLSIALYEEPKIYHYEKLVKIPVNNVAMNLNEFFVVGDQDKNIIEIKYYPESDYKIQIKPDEIFYTSRDKTLIGSILANSFGKIKSIFLKNRKTPDNDNPKKFTFLALADAGIEGFNYLTDNDLKINKKYDDEGNLVAYSFVSDNFQIFRSVKK